MRNGHRLISMLLCTFLMLAAYDAKAIPVLFKLTLDVTDVSEDPLSCGGPIASFGCGNTPGDVHTGVFSVDSGLLALEGDNLPGGVSNFFLRIGNVVWDQANPAPASDFEGFRDAAAHVGAPSFDVDVHGGTITDVHGGVFGPADLPALDFAPLAGLSPGTFIAVDLDSTALEGNLLISRVAEPPVLFLVSIGLSMWALLRIRRRLALARVGDGPVR